MPLKHGKSEAAFKSNVKTEMEHGKPQDQALAIAYSVKRKKKAAGGSVQSGSPDMNMAEGGVISAHSESRPSTQQEHNDKHEVARNAAAKALDPKANAINSSNRTSAQKGPRTTPIKHPSMVPQSGYSTRMRDEEDHLQATARPGNPGAQPSSNMNEEGADRSGPVVRKTDGRHMSSSTEVTRHHDEPSLKRTASPSMDEGTSTAHSDNEEGPDRHGPAEKSTQGKTGSKPTHGLSMMAEGGEATKQESPKGVDYIVPDVGFGKIIVMKAEGGEIHREMMMQPEEEAREEHANSIAAAIMAEDRRKSQSSDSDMDDMVHMAEGGILSMDATETTQDTQADLSRNAQEDNNHEDQLSFNALRKENYSESAGLKAITHPMDSNETGDDRESSRSNKHSMVDEILRKMRARKQMPTE